MAVDNIKELKHNASQGVTHDTVLTRIGTLTNNNLKALLLAVMGKSENVIPLGLGITWINTLTVKVNKGVLYQYIDDIEMMLGIEPDDSADISLTSAHATLDRVDIIQAKVERVASNSQSFNVWDGANIVPSSGTIDYKTQISFSKKDGTAGTGVPATPDSGYIKIAEITVRAASTNLNVNDIKDVYQQNNWIIPQTIYLDRHNYSIRTDLNRLRIDFEEYVQTLKAFSVSDNTTKKSTKFTLDLNPSLNITHPQYLKSNPFVNDYLSDGRPRYGAEYISPLEFYLNDYNFWCCEDNRIKMQGSWYQDLNIGFYTCSRSGDALYITFQGTGLLLQVKSNSISTNSLQIEVDNAVATSQNLNNSININDSCLIKIAEGLSDGIHTAKIYLNEDKQFAWKSLTILSPVTDNKVLINKGTHYILDSAINFTAMTEIILNSYVANGERDTIYITREGNVEVGNGTSIGLTPLYGVSTNHNSEEVSFNLDILNYHNIISKVDNWTGIFSSTNFEYKDSFKTGITTINNSSTVIELRFFGTGIDIDLLVSTGDINWSIDGVMQTAITPSANIRQIVKLCSNLTYGSHIIRLAFTSIGATVDFFNAIIYRPRSVYDVSFEEKLPLTTINRVKSGSFKNYHLDQLALLDGSNWSKIIENVNYPAGIILQNSNTVASQTMEFWFIGTRFILYGNKNTDLGRFNITVDTSSFTNVDEYAASPAYNVPVWDSEIDGTLTLSYGIHKVIITTTNSKNGSSSGFNLQFGMIAVELPNGWLDYEFNPFYSDTEKQRENGVSQTIKKIEKENVFEHDWNKKEHNKLRSEIEYVQEQLDLFLPFKKQITFTQKYGFWGEVWYKDEDEIVIKPKTMSDVSWIGAILNDGEYLESSSAITIKYNTPANSGHILNGIEKLANSWQIIRPYKDVSGNLAFGFDWQPITTFSEANPTNTLTLAQVDSKDIGLCFPVGAEIVVFDSSTKIQTPIWYSGGSYDPTGGLYIASRTGSVLTLNKNLNISSLSGGKIVYTVNGFKPINYITGQISSNIGLRGYSDIGIRIKTDASGNIINFIIIDNKFYFTTVNLYSSNTAFTTIFRINNIVPPDKQSILTVRSLGSAASTSYIENFYGYYSTLAKRDLQSFQSDNSVGISRTTAFTDISQHGLIKYAGYTSWAASTLKIDIIGYEI